MRIFMRMAALSTIVAMATFCVIGNAYGQTGGGGTGGAAGGAAGGGTGGGASGGATGGGARGTTGGAGVGGGGTTAGSGAAGSGTSGGAIQGASGSGGQPNFGTNTNAGAYANQGVSNGVTYGANYGVPSQTAPASNNGSAFQNSAGNQNNRNSPQNNPGNATPGPTAGGLPGANGPAVAGTGSAFNTGSSNPSAYSSAPNNPGGNPRSGQNPGNMQNANRPNGSNGNPQSPGDNLSNGQPQGEQAPNQLRPGRATQGPTDQPRQGNAPGSNGAPQNSPGGPNQVLNGQKNSQQNGGRQSPTIGVTLTAHPTHGVTVYSVSQDTPAEQAGLRAGDQIVAVNGRYIASNQDLIAIIQKTDSQKGPLNLEVMRNGQSNLIHATLTPTQAAANSNAQNGSQSNISRERPALGLTMQPDEAHHLRITRVMPASAADQAGLLIGDRIISVSRKRVDQPYDVIKLLAQSPVDQAIPLQIERNGREQTLWAYAQDKSREKTNKLEPGSDSRTKD